MDPFQRYLSDMRAIRAAGHGTAETSYYGPLEALINAAGEKLRPRVHCTMQGKDIGAGRPDGVMSTQGLGRKKGKRAGITFALGLTPDRGAIEAKPVSDAVPRVAASKQVSTYLGLYNLVLVTNFRDFLLVENKEGRAVELERFTIAPTEQAFWDAADDAPATCKAIGSRFMDFLERVLMQESTVEAPEQVARFLASYAREALGRLESTDVGLGSLRAAIEESLGMEFREGEGLDFFRSTIVQTLFYGLFSAWVLWHREKPDRASDFDWRTATWSLDLPAVGAVFAQLAQPSGVGKLGLSDPLDWAAHLLNRVNRTRFFARFEQEHAVQYFYEPFLKEFDPELRKQLGVWYTPPEVVKYMVARVDMALRDELGIADGLADENVYVLDPCCGTGAYLVEVLRRIEKTLIENRGEDALIGADVHKAALERVFGFEIMPAPFVVAHMQLGLHLQQIRAPLTARERTGVFLTNALTGWEPDARPPKLRLYPELSDEWDAAEHVKRDRPILVVLGNPPYNGFAGVAVEEERDLTEAYRTTVAAPPPRGQGLNDLYVRFFRMAERRIAERTGRGIVCYISNYSWLDGLSFTGMRERYLDAFDSVWIDSLNGDKYKTGKLTPDGKPDPSIFSTESNREGIQVGTAITMLVRKAGHQRPASPAFRNLWGQDKHQQLAASAHSWAASDYQTLRPDIALGLPFVPMSSSAGYLQWPTLPALFPRSFPGVKTSRDQLVVDIDRDRLVARMERYFDVRVGDDEIAREVPAAMQAGKRYSPHETRATLVRRGLLSNNFFEFHYRPFDTRWLYWEPEADLLDRRRDDAAPHVMGENVWLAAGQQNRKRVDPCSLSWGWSSLHLIERGANLFPLYLHPEPDVNVANVSSALGMLLADKGWAPEKVFRHVVAVLSSRAYLRENDSPLRQDWPRIPVPSSTETVEPSAELGRGVLDLLNHRALVAGVTHGSVRPELRLIGGLFSPAPDFTVAARWGIRGQGGVVMPGPGMINERAFLAEEREAIERGAAGLGLSPDEAFACLGDRTYDIYLNPTTYWKNIPERVWNYTMGGYQVLKKWLSYREAELLGRPLRAEEARYFQEVARRIAAILLMGPELDRNYEAAKASAIVWPPVPATGEDGGAAP